MIRLTYIDKWNMTHVLWCVNEQEKAFYIQHLLKTNPDIKAIY